MHSWRWSYYKCYLFFHGKLKVSIKFQITYIYNVFFRTPATHLQILIISAYYLLKQPLFVLVADVLHCLFMLNNHIICHFLYIHIYSIMHSRSTLKLLLGEMVIFQFETTHTHKYQSYINRNLAYITSIEGGGQHTQVWPSTLYPKMFILPIENNYYQTHLAFNWVHFKWCLMCD